MNRIFRSIWQERLGICVAVSEHARVKGSRAGVSVGLFRSHADGREYREFALRCISASVLLAFTSLSLAGPTGAIVAAGSASVAGSPSNLIVTQGSQNAILNWQSFNIGAGASVRFVQPNPNAVALNRVLGSDASSIYGALSANGKVFLVNPNGILNRTGFCGGTNI